ncbi:MAG: MarR family winged helix-turn-helix transcriptional regulator [Christensenellales bacterium]
MDAMNNEFKITRKIFRIANHLVNERNNDVRAFSITAKQSDALQFFNTHTGASASGLKGHLGISHQAARNLVERMKKSGLLHVAVSDEDARYRSVCLTEKGKRLCDDLKQYSMQRGDQLLAGFSGEELDQLMVFLDRISANLDS